MLLYLKLENKMGKVKNLIKKINIECEICGKSVVSSYNRPHSLHKTKRVVKPNLQKYRNKIICTSCLKKAK